MYRVKRLFLIFGLLEHFEFVADAPNGFEYPLVGNTVEFFTQTFYVYVNGSRVAQIVESPYFVEKLIAGENSV